MTALEAQSHQVRWMDSFFKRLTGAITRPINETGEVLVFSPGGSIHTWFMRYNLHVFFLDQNRQILLAHANVRPWKMLRAPKGTMYVAECGANQPFSIVESKLPGLLASR